ncbi:MAG: PQQ-binding-like beta-propeller repeat protein [Gammaproteobacteria bacterium]|nr:PQQ-binding-like beta-propeller repeat protein [Gammaproteobacteria bacterium]MDD9957819.1 PQQ-binding-like beta-propeller repeat protein [Gammaproteobacteria bacterium]
MKPRFAPGFLSLLAGLFTLFSSESFAQDDNEPHPGEPLYMENCAACHDEPFYKAPSRQFLSALGPRNILNVLNEGAMREQAAALSTAQRSAIAEYLSGISLADVVDPLLPPACDADHDFNPALPPVSRGFGVDLENTRFQPADSGGLTAGNIHRLEVKWSFAYPNSIQARSEPVYGGGGIYVGSQDGTVWSLDAETGCLRWMFNATAEVRTGIAITPWIAEDDEIDPLIFFGDVIANVYAVSARTGELRWKVRADDHRDATMTGTPSVYNDRLYVPVSSLEVVAAGDGDYECCSFRGALLSLDTATGDQHWKSYTTDSPPEVVGQNQKGTDILAPSGAPIWSSPTIDSERNQVYVGTGENYSSPADGNSDAIIAFDLLTGEKKWVAQQTRNDAWNTACFIGFPGIDNSNCPEEDGPDYDFGSHPILVKLPNGNDIVVGGQKSGHAMGIDPDSGETLWRTAVGRGGIQGGVHFGIAAESNSVYIPINDLNFPGDEQRYQWEMPAKPGVYAVNAVTGEFIWSAPAPTDVCGNTPFCTPGVSQAITAIPGAVIAGHLDGRIRVYSREDGSVLWEKNLLGSYQTVSGEEATGGAFSGGGVLIAHGQMFVNAGYGYNFHIPGNALVVLGLAD